MRHAVVLTMLVINHHISIELSDIEFTAIRSSGSGGQHVNKVSSAIQLRFNILASSLPTRVKQNLLSSKDVRRTNDGIIVIKSQNHRSQHQNKDEAIRRLQKIIVEASYEPKTRIKTKPSKANKRKRLDDKKRKSTTKALRHKIIY